jgi:nitric oxide reductase large subunit
MGWCSFAPESCLFLHQHWPPEPLVGNHPTAGAIVWSVLSLIALLGVIGLLLAVFGKPLRPSVKNLGPVLRVGLWNIERALNFELILSALMGTNQFERLKEANAQGAAGERH